MQLFATLRTCTRSFCRRRRAQPPPRCRMYLINLRHSVWFALRSISSTEEIILELIS